MIFQVCGMESAIAQNGKKRVAKPVKANVKKRVSPKNATKRNKHSLPFQKKRNQKLKKSKIRECKKLQNK